VNAISLRQDTTSSNSQTRWRPPQLSSDDVELLERGCFADSSPVPTAEQAGRLIGILLAFRSGFLPAEEAEIARLVGGAALAYPAVRLSAPEAEARLRLYVAGLNDVPHHVLESAMMDALKKHRFYPSISEIRACVDGRLAPIWERYGQAENLLRAYFAQHGLGKTSPEVEEALEFAEASGPTNRGFNWRKALS
jgi:hypothetical protein